MRQVLQSRSGLTVVREVPAPPCAPAGVLVRNAFSAISSGTERARVEPGRQSLVSRARERPDLVRQTVERALRDGIKSTREAVERKLHEESAAGYSSAGTVLEVGARVRGLRPGDLVACAGAGHANHAEVVSVPANLCAKVPEDVPLPAAALTTIAAIALHAIRVSEVRVGERAAVIGCGLVGQIACRLLRSSGAEVYALDIDPGRVADAVAGGADHGLNVAADVRGVIATLTGGAGVDHAIVTAAASTSDPLRLGAEILRDRGALTLVGDVPIDVPRGPLYMKELVFRVSRSYGPGRYDLEYEERGLDYPLGYVRWTEQRNMEAVMGLQQRGLLSLEDLIEEIVPVEDAARAYERLTGEGAERPRGAILLSYPDGDRASAGRGAAAPVREPSNALPSSGAAAVGFVGCGSFARDVLVPAFQASGARLELVGGGSGPSADAAVRHLGFARMADSEQAVIDDEAIDAVVIGTRHESHARLVTDALTAGKHVFCEKPVALSVEELEHVTAAAQESAGILAVGFNRRFSPLLVELRDFVRGGAGGPLTATYRVSAGEIPGDHWVHDLEQGGGRIVGEVCHFLDVLHFVAGSAIVEVHATGHGRAAPALQTTDNVIVSVKHADGSVGSVVYVARSAPSIAKERLEAFGPGGIGILDDYRSLELHGPAGKRGRTERRQEKGHREEVAAFLGGVRTGTAPVPLADVVNVSRATLAAVESMRTGLPVRVDP
jgi:predicted dehydrogenase/threonine dehydrogenase-like Zn-dependent dehydrogenase